VPSSTTTPGTGTTPGSGVVTGLVTLGPTRSVQRIGDPDPYEPVGQGTVVATSADGQEVGRAPIGADGRYRFELGPGEVTVTATGTGAMRCDPVTVTVAARVSVTADVRCDTGRR
jgi:VCBS repeat-containing protein